MNLEIRLPLSTAVLSVLLWASLPSAAQVRAASTPTHAAASSTRATDTRGYLYGTVALRNGQRYEGRLRWGKEEAFWTDHFNASKEDRPLAREIPREHRSHAVRILGLSIGLRLDSRQLIVRFGDIASIVPRGHGEATLVLKGGEELEIGGGSNDMGRRVTIFDRSLGEVEVHWDKIRRIDFKATPADLPDAPARFFGTVKTKTGTLKGFIQWDKEECLATDRIDGRSDDGKVSIELGKIAAIERHGRRSSTLFLKDGREIDLSGTNDVDSDNRGIFVDDPRYGRVLVSWRAFDRLDVEDGGSGPGYDEFPPLGKLRGTVRTRSGASLKGHVVYDVDESRAWEMLDGEEDQMTYSIPFWNVASIAPKGSGSRVKLRQTDVELFLTDSADVSDRNAGVFILDGGKKTYVAWEDVERIDLER
jgi:hypothetical protein